MADPQYSDLPPGAQLITGAPLTSAPSTFSDLPAGAQVLHTPAFSDLPQGATLLSAPHPHDPDARFAFGGGDRPVEIREAPEPSIWERITKVFTEGIPHYSSRTVYDPEYGKAQLVTPEAGLTPAEQRAHPMLTGLGQAAGSLTTPENIALLYGTAGLGELPGAARLLPRLFSLGFSGQAVHNAYQTVPAIRDAWNRGDVAEVERLFTQGVVDLGMAALGTQHAVTGEAVPWRKGKGVKTAAAESKPESQPLPTVPLHPTSPLADVLHEGEQPPVARVAESAAAANAATEADTLRRPQPSTDRRLDIARRKVIEEMTPEEKDVAIGQLRKERLTSPLTGLPNRAAFDEATPSPYVAMSDADGLKALNDTFGYEAGNNLLRAKAEALREAGLDAYHDKGDEFLMRGDSKAELAEKLEDARKILRDKVIEADHEGVKKYYRGAEFSYGIGEDLTEAESAKNADKEAREAAGIRAPRGQFRGLAEVGPEGRSIGEGLEQRGTGEDLRAQAKVTAPADVLAFRNPTARVVTDSHVPVVSTDAILTHAVQTIVNNSGELQRLGLDPSTINTLSDVNSVLQIASDHIRSNLDPRAYGPITFEGQKALAADLGMSVEDLLRRKGGEAFNAEELVAARSLLEASKRRVLSMARAATNSGTPEDLTDFTTALAQHQAVQEVIAGVRAEAGRALGSFRIGEADLPTAKISSISSILASLPEDVRAEAARLLTRLDPTDPQTVRRINQFTEKITPHTSLEKLHEYYRNALLSSPHTIIVKTTSEAALAAMETMKKVVAGGLAKFKENPDRFAAEAWYYAKGMAQALAEHARPILSGDFQLEGSPGFEQTGTQAIKGLKGRIVRAPSEAMSRMTNLIYAGNYFGEINSLAARQAIIEGLDGDAFHARQEYLSHHPTPDMQEAAHKLATTNTFQNELGKFGKLIESGISYKPKAEWLPERARSAISSTAPGRFLFPFFRTPINLLKASLTHATPFELINGIAKGDVDSMARGVVGSSIAASLAYLALNGQITGGGPTDFRKQETLRATGWQPYSLKIGDRYYSYKRFEPVGLVAGLIADTVHGMSTGDPEVVTQAKAGVAVRQIMRNLDDFPFLGTLSNILQSVHDPTSGLAQGTLNRMAGSLVPAGLANVAESIDPTVRRPRSMSEAIQARVPGLADAAQPIIDVRGQVVRRPASNVGGAFPFEWQTARHDPVTDELARLQISTPQAPKQIKFRGKQTELTEAEQRQLIQEENKQLYEKLSRWVTSPSWNRFSDDQKKVKIESYHREISKDRSDRLAKMRQQAQAGMTARPLRQLAGPGSP